MEFNLLCRDNWVGDLGGEAAGGTIASFGQHWTSPWLCYVKQSAEIWTFYSGVGSAIPFHGFSTSDDPNYVAGWLDYRQRFTTYMSGGARVVRYINGARDIFGYSAADGLGYTRYFLTQRIDPHGNQLTFSYSQLAGTVFLETITDPDGHQVIFDHDVVNGVPVITSVSDAYGHTVALGYNAEACLDTITDAAGLTSYIGYNSAGGSLVPNQLITPYGTTTFFNSQGEAVLVNENGLARHLFVRQDNDYLGRIPTSYSAMVPSTVGGTFSFANTFDTEAMEQRNSYYWNPRQYELLPLNFRTALESGTYDNSLLTSASFRVGRQRHWLVNESIAGLLSLERAPSPDGSRQGQITWYDYPGKESGDPTLAGSMMQPYLVAWKLPNGQSRFTCYLRNEAGRATNIIETYTGAAGDVRVRTNSIVYSADHVDVLSVTNAAGVRVEHNLYNANHEVTTNYNALNERTVFTYDANGRLSTITHPTGLVTTNRYGSDGYLAETRDIGVRTNSYTWYNGLVQTHTDERGLTVTKTWDGLNRLRKIAYPDGTYETNIYRNLDLVETIDRMGFHNRYEYNGLRQRTAVIDALNRTNQYGYCNCGALTSSTDALNQTTSHYYDYAGHLIQTVHPDNFHVTYNLDLLGHVTNIVDAAGYSVTNWYNNQGLLAASSNAWGRVSSAAYDVLDQPTSSTDANGVTVTSTFDNLGRILTRTYPDNGAERYGYTLNIAGATRYTNQVGAVTSYAYDAAGRRTFETNANNELIRFTNNPAGDLLSLTDGKGQMTRWGYNPYGQVTNKVDQAGAVVLRYTYDLNGRLTNRWSAAKGNTKYVYDPVDNLTNVDYAVSTDIRMQYDPLNRLTNMVDAAGTTRFTYTAAGLLLTEDGPFASDILTNLYSNRLRTRLSLQQPTGLWTNAFGYDAAKRLTNVTSPAGAFGYLYLAPRFELPARLTLPSGAYITNIYDTVGRLTSTSLRNSGHTVLDSYTYAYNPASQRTNLTRADASTVGFRYDPIGQLTVADSSVNTEDRGYFYDAAWNLNRRTNNGTPSTFSVDVKNQLTTIPGGSCGYDGNGNLTSDPSRSFTYDDENQLTRVTWGSGNYRTDFTYDGQGRMRKRLETFNNAGTWTVTSETWYLYDGMRVIQERNNANTPQVSYTRGRDLSGTLEGAGGIGGLLARSHGYSGGNWPTHHAYFADGNGNVVRMLDSAQAISAAYRYDPYGNQISATGTMSAANVYRFSSKERIYDGSVSGYYYYGYRFYDPNLQRWLNRDPLEELGGINLYQFSLADPANRIDSYGKVSLPAALAIAKVLWEGICASYALNQAVAWNPSNDSHEHKKHCLVGCLMTKCQAGLSLGDLVGQPLKEVVWGFKDRGWPWNWDWREAVKDTLATYRGHLYGFKLFFGDCKKDCDCKPLNS